MIRCFSHEEVQSSGLGLCFMMGVELNFSPSDRSFLRSFWPRMGDNWVVAGVPSVSVLDGWWIEGCIEGVTGWSIGPPDGATTPSADHSNDAGSLYDKLEQIIMPLVPDASIGGSGVLSQMSTPAVMILPIVML